MNKTSSESIVPDFTSQSPVSSYNEWGLLEEVIVGRIENACMAPDQPAVRAVVPDAVIPELSRGTGKPMPEGLITKANEELNEFIRILEGEGVTVRRPDIYDHTRQFETPDWESTGLCSACPRDGFLVIGDEIIETPMAWRSRYHEGLPYRSLFRDYFNQGARWTSAPKPALLDSLYKSDFVAPAEHDTESPMDYVINDSEVVFDAADFIRCGKDIFCHLSNVTNRSGIQWLQRHLGDQYRIHVIDTSLWRKPMHIDASFVPLRPGLVLINPDDIDVDKLPTFTKQWDFIIAPRPNKSSGTAYSYLNMCSDWLSANVLSLDENRVIVEAQQTTLMDSLKAYGLEVIPCAFEHFSPFGGAFHCATLDIRRQGQLESYFDV